MSAPTLTVTTDITKQVNEIVDRFKYDGVLVGIPGEDTDRKDSDEVTNAFLLAVAEIGSPVNNIPARRPLSTGIRLAKDKIAEEFKKAAQAAFTQGVSAIRKYYERAGTIASNSVKQVINQQIDMDPPSEATLARRKSEGFKGTKALIVTGQMRNAITYVVTGKL